MMPIWNLDSLVDLVFIGLLFGISFFLQSERKSEFYIAYWLIAHVGLLLWLRRDIGDFNIPGLVTVIWSIYAILLHWEARRHKQFLARSTPHVLSLVVAFLLIEQFLWFRPATDALNLLSFFNLTIIGLIFAASFLLTETEETNYRISYRLVAHVALLTWFWREFSLLNGQGLVTIVWGIYAVFLLTLALYLRNQLLRLVALATLFVLVGKLFLVDLVVVETVWRILLFAGFGGLFLFISYFYGSWLGLSEPTD